MSTAALGNQGFGNRQPVYYDGIESPIPQPRSHGWHVPSKQGVSVSSHHVNFDTHSKTVGYLLWLLGFTGAHRFYYGKPLTGVLWFFTLGLFGIGWVFDLFLIPAMDREADSRFRAGPVDYSLVWLLFMIGGLFGLHRFGQGKWFTGLVFLLTAGLLGLGLMYDLFTMNQQVSVRNASWSWSIHPGP